MAATLSAVVPKSDGATTWGRTRGELSCCAPARRDPREDEKDRPALQQQKGRLHQDGNPAGAQEEQVACALAEQFADRLPDRSFRRNSAGLDSEEARFVEIRHDPDPAMRSLRGRKRGCTATFLLPVVWCHGHTSSLDHVASNRLRKFGSFRCQGVIRSPLGHGEDHGCAERMSRRERCSAT
jgi:hypothetical protein